jgi:drug/metabolite transporter (DMT)-like permease
LLAVLCTTLSASVVVLNKYILTRTSFRYVYFLSFFHSTLASILSWTLFLAIPRLDRNSDLKHEKNLFWHVCFISGMFSASLIASNAALARLDVSTVQLLKAMNPAILYFLGVVAHVERPSGLVCFSLCAVCGGVVFAVQDIFAKLHPTGVVLQIMSLLCDGARAIYLQATLQASKPGLDSLNLLYRVAPTSALMLWVAGSIVEFPSMRPPCLEDRFAIVLVISGAILAFALNLCSYAFIKRTSALTLSVSSIFKDIMLIVLSASFWHSKVGWRQVAGYAIAAVATVFYNRFRIIRHQKYCSRPSA